MLMTRGSWRGASLREAAPCEMGIRFLAFGPAMLELFRAFLNVLENGSGCVVVLKDGKLRPQFERIRFLKNVSNEIGVFEQRKGREHHMVRRLPWRGRLIRHAYGYGSGGIDDGLIATPRGKKGKAVFIQNYSPLWRYDRQYNKPSSMDHEEKPEKLSRGFILVKRPLLAGLLGYPLHYPVANWVKNEGVRSNEQWWETERWRTLMERLQGPMNPCFFGEHLDVEGLEHGRSSLELGYGPLLSTESQRSEEEQALFSTPSLEDKMPFLQMLQSITAPKEALGMTHLTELDSRIQARELESCITHDILEMHSPVKSETKEPQHHQHSTPCLEGTSSECNQDQPNSAENGCLDTNSGSSPAWVQPQTRQKQAHLSKSPPITRERRKRKRTRPTKNKEEVESQRMTHIAVERNRRRQMNDHLNALRSLMPTSYIQRGDQASIIGGAIDFVKELEQLLESLQAQKRMRRSEEGGDASTNSSSSSPKIASKGLCTQHRFAPDESNSSEGGRSEEFTFTADNKSAAADIEVTVIQTHVNLKIQCPRRPGQLLKAIVALEDLSLTVLHLNITSLQSTVLYSFNLKIEDDCKLGSADEVAAAVHQVFSFINGSS
ncbi:hypothetical protein AAG906_005228 [Vitis piasezkii]